MSTDRMLDVGRTGTRAGGYGALMISTPDGGRTLTVSITAGDAPMDPAQEGPKALDELVKTVFRDGPTRAG